MSNPKDNKRQGSYIRKVKTSTHVVIDPDKEKLLTLSSGPKGFKKSLGSVIIVLTPGGQQQLTVHRPIGITPYDDHDWAISYSRDIPVLLSRVKHPGKAGFDKLETSYRIKAFQATNPMWVLDKDNIFQFKGCKRNDVVNSARDVSRKEWRRVHPVYQRRKGEKAPPKAPIEPKDEYLKFIKDEQIRDAERQYYLFREKYSLPEDVLAKWKEDNPFETKSGVTANVSQTVFPVLKGMNQAVMVDSIINAMLSQKAPEIREVRIERPPSPKEEVKEASDLSGYVEISQMRYLSEQLLGAVEQGQKQHDLKKSGKSHERWGATLSRFHQLAEALNEYLDVAESGAVEPTEQTSVNA